MNTFLFSIGLASLFAVAMMTLPLLGALGGALSGWVVGWFFSETILSFMAAFGVKGLAMWQIGMALGFVGGFFKSTQTNANK